MSLLSVKQVTRTFGGLVALSSVDLEVKEGELVGLIGPNGAGKTTLFNVITGFVPPTSGEIWFDGAATTGLAPHEVAQRGLGRTFQVVKPFGHLSVLQNVMVGAYSRTRNPREAKERAEAVLEQMGMFGKRHQVARDMTLPERKRLEVARALATQPRLLLLDEVMAGLNPTEVRQAADLFERVRRSGVTILAIEHIMKVIMRISDRIVVLHHGEKLAEGTPAEIARDQTVIQAYLGREQPHARG